MNKSYFFPGELAQVLGFKEPLVISEVCGFPFQPAPVHTTSIFLQFGHCIKMTGMSGLSPGSHIEYFSSMRVRHFGQSRGSGFFSCFAIHIPRL